MLLFKKIKNNNKNYPVGVGGGGGKQEHGKGLTGKARAGYNQGNIDDELAHDCKYKEIINGANEEGTGKHRWGKLTNNQEMRWVGSRQLTREHVAHSKLRQKPSARTKHKHMASKN